MEVLEKVLMDERSEWAKVRDELHVMFTTFFYKKILQENEAQVAKIL